jgi:DNA polymerase III epsilon subunit-like protein
MKFLKALFAKTPKADYADQDDDFETADEVIARTNKMAMQMFAEFEEANKTGQAGELVKKYSEKYGLDQSATVQNSVFTAKGQPVVLPDFAHKSHRFICVDVETSNEKPSSICQIGLAFVSEAGVTSSHSLLIDPEDNFTPTNSTIHGIHQQMVEEAPNFVDAMIGLRDLLERHTLVQHSPFDKRAFDAACARYRVAALDSKWIDSIKVSKSAWPEFKESGGYGLANMTRLLQINFKHHDAGEDAKATAEIVLAAEKVTGKSYDHISSIRSKRVASPTTVEGNSSGQLYGEIACFTGELSMSRAEASKAAASLGISVKNGVTKKTTMLIVGDQDLELLAGHPKSTKHRKAEELIAKGQNITVLSETQFVELLNSGV